MIKKLFKKNKLTRFIFFFVADILFISLSIYLALLLRLDGKIPINLLQNFPYIIGIALLVSLPIFYLHRLYYFTWAYVSISDLIQIFKAVTLSSLAFGTILFLLRGHWLTKGIPRSVILISYFLILLLIAGLRVSKRLYYNLFNKKEKTSGKRILLIGAGDAGEQLARNILTQTNDYRYHIIGFVDDSPMKQKVSIHGIKVLGNIAQSPKIIKDYQIEQVFIALPQASSSLIKKILNIVKQAKIEDIKILPPITEMFKGKAGLTDLRPIKIQDLLGRDIVKINLKNIKELLYGKTILITGAAGSIGSELAKQCAKFTPQLLILVDQDETRLFNVSRFLKNNFSDLKLKPIIADICDQGRIEQIFQNLQPETVFHAAAYKHVGLMEEYPEEAIKNNILGTLILGQAAQKYKAKKFILVSTDKAVRPSSAMGASKRSAELLIKYFNSSKQGSQTQFSAVRFGNVLASRGSVIPIFQEQIKKGGPITITHPEMKRYFMMISEAVLLILEAGSLSQGGEIFILDMGNPIKIVDLAKEMIKLSGLEPDLDIAIIFTKPHQGEKLEEGLFNPNEEKVLTLQKKIFIAKGNEEIGEEYFESIKKLIEISKNKNNKNEIKKELFKLTNSKF